MKKLLVTLFITISFSGLLTPAISHAWQPPAPTPGNNDSYALQNNYNAFVATNKREPSDLNELTIWRQGLGTANANANAALNKNQEILAKETACGINPFALECLKASIYWVFDTIGNTILTFTSWILWACGIILNFSIITFVIEMKARIASIGAIYVIWQTVRDLANMFFIFILLAIAIQTILDVGKDYKTLLKNVILVALFINFSFFITGFLIDTSNIIAMQFYNGFAGSNGTGFNAADGGISGKVVAALKLGSIYDANAASTAASTTAEKPRSSVLSSSQGVGAFFITVIMGSILMIITGGVFLASAILIIYRFIELAFILMLSPLAFISFSFPALNEFYDEWSKRLKKQLIFAPVYFMFLWMVMKMISNGALQPKSSYTDAIAGNSTSLFGLISSFVIIIALLIYSLTLATRLGANASAVKWAGKASDFVRNKTLGLAAKHTVGRAAAGLDKAWSKSTIPVIGGTGYLGNRLRNITTSAVAKSKLGGDESFIEHQKVEKDRKKARTEQVRKNVNDETLKAGTDALKVDPAVVAAMTVPQRTEHEDKIQKLANLTKTVSGKDLTGMKSEDLITLAEAGMISPDKMVAILDDKNENHTSPEKDKIRAAYSKKVNDKINLHLNPPPGATPATIIDNERAAKAAIADLGEDGIRIVDPTLTNGRDARSEAFIQMASGKQYKKIIEATHGDGKNAIRDARFKTILDPATTIPDLTKRFRGLDSADIAHLANNANPGSPYETAFNRILALPDITDHANASKLLKAWDDEGLSSAKAAEIMTAISRPLPAGATPTQITNQTKLVKKLTDFYFGI